MATNTTSTAYSTNLVSNTAFYYATDTNNIIFEFTAINASSLFNVTPLFEPFPTSPGFSNVNSIAKLNVPVAKLNNLFYFEGYNISTEAVIPIKYGINLSYKFDISYSNASVTSGAINTAISVIPKIKYDYVNYLATSVTGGYNVADIFSNAPDLVANVIKMDPSFNSKINTSILNASLSSNATNDFSVVRLGNASVFLDTSMNTSPYIQGARTLINGLLSIVDRPRGQQFLTDISNQNFAEYNVNSSSTYTSYYNIPFRAGDIVSVLVNYVPPNGNGNPIAGLGTNPVYNRSYKIMLYLI